ncbi:MAG: hypothetical protein FJW23_12105 [Acidimicrobiia bacterium]|nr:hypothetical protein [Acidimicrobiia bacterium]
MSTEPGRELQLRGKQLVFVFMASTVAAVVVFLCGVMVGRGVRTEVAGLTVPSSYQADPTADLALPPPSLTTTTSSGASPAVNEDLSYPDRLVADAPPDVLAEPLAEVTADAADVDEAEAESPGPPDEAETEENAADPALEPPPGDGFTIQVAAIRARGEAERMARHLADKGYSAYVTVPPGGGPRVYRVRVGKFRERREAEAIASRLQKEEQFKPWVTR